MEQIAQTSNLALQLLVNTLPIDCVCRTLDLELAAAIAGECISREATARGFDWRKDEVIAAVTLKAAIIGGQYKVPQEVHNEICGCQKRAHRGSREQIMQPMARRIQELELPTQENPKVQNGVCYYAVPGGSRKYPNITVWFRRDHVTGAILGSAYWYPNRPDVWSLYTNIAGPKYLTAVSTPDQAISDILSDLRSLV